MDFCACVVEPRIVRRALRRAKGGGSGVHVPHARCFWVERDTLPSITSQAERASVPAGQGPVILVARPDRPSDVEVERATFHARVHLALEAHRSSGELDEATVRARVHAIGQTAFDEVRAVLREDDLLLPGAGEVDVWIELAATWLELARFEPRGLAETFPTVDAEVVTRLLAEDVPELAGGSLRPASVAPPGSAPQASSAPVRPARRAADAGSLSLARERGNLVRALLDGDGDPREDLERLETRVRAAVGSAAPLAAALSPLVLAARARSVPTLSPEGRLLFDLQRAAIAHERASRLVDPLTALFSWGRVPVVRALPASRAVRVRHALGKALRKVPKTALGRDDQEQLRDVLERLEGESDDRLRAELRSPIVDALAEVGLRPRGVAEEVARDKLVDELLDRVATHGFFGVGDLRDGLARNQLKCEDLSLRALLSGDALLAADERLASRLDGVYRRGEIYLRFLQKVSSVAFGTRLGRLLSTGVILPVLAAFVLLEGVQHVVGPLAKKLAHVHVHLLSNASWLGLSLALFLLLHVQIARTVGWALLRGLGLALHAAFVSAPRWVLGRPLVRALLSSRPVELATRFLLKPAVIAVPAYLVARRLHASPHGCLVVAASAVPLASAVLNSPPFALLSEICVDAIARAFRNLRTRVLPGIFAALLDVVRAMVEQIERLIYRIDEALLFREGEGRVALVAKGLGNVGWTIVTFVVRLYVNLLIEPQVNPIKHFPVVTVSHKIMLPFVPTLLAAFRLPLMPLGAVIANTVAGATVFLLPGVFGFLAWELKENRRLYRASLETSLRPVRIGGHGETMTALLVPGFHSGTLPKLRTALRRSGRRIARKDALLALSVRSHTNAQTELHHNEEAVARFVERELCALLARSPRWRGPRLGAPRVHIGSNRVAVTLRRADGQTDEQKDDRPLTFAFEEQSGFVLAHVAERGFVDALAEEDRLVLRDALAGLYALAAVDFVREDLERALAGAPYDVSDEGLVVWPDGSFRSELVYDLHGHGESEPRVRGEPRGGSAARKLDRDALRFPAIPWEQWERSWSESSAAPIVDRAVL